MVSVCVPPTVIVRLLPTLWVSSTSISVSMLRSACMMICSAPDLSSKRKKFAVPPSPFIDRVRNPLWVLFAGNDHGGVFWLL
ncbi:hypothetical protein D3C76_1545580 [compost metagenome]